ncbi:RNA-directed DNA polymerase from mobile element jockey, partial [Frankliniella fusca]
SCQKTQLNQHLQTFCDTCAKQLKIIHLNAQSLTYRCHIEEFIYMFDGTKHDIISVSETFYNDVNDIVQLSGYNAFVSNRTSHEGGGVAVYVRNQLPCKILGQSTSPPFREQRPDYIILEIKLQSTKILFACIYRPPKAGHLSLFQEELFELCTEYENVFVTGDVNAHFGSKKPCDLLDSSAIHHLLEICNLHRVPFGPTYHAGTVNSSLDMIATNCIDKLVDFIQIPVCGLSAHDLIYASFMLNVPKFKKKTVTHRDFSGFDVSVVQRDILAAPWEGMFTCVDIDEKVEMFNGILLKIYDEHAPFKSFVCKHQPKPWVTQEIVSVIKQRDMAYKRYRRSRTQCDLVVYKSLRNTVNRIRRDAKMKYALTVFNSSKSPKDLWQSLKNLDITGKSHPPCNFPPADELNEHYASVVCADPEAVEDKINYYNMLPALVEEKFYFADVTPSDLIKAVKTVSSNAIGVDNVSIKMLKSCIVELSPPILHLFNYSLQSGCFPQLWKIARVKPIPKKANATVPKDFRPINLLCILGKILEKIKLPSVRPPVIVENIPVPYLDSVNNLGLTIDNTLNWEKSAIVTCNKSIAALHGLRRHKDMLPMELRKRLVQCLIFPILDYGSVVTFGMLVKSAEKLQRVQNACARFVFNLPRDCHITQYLTKLKWLPVTQRRNLHSLCLLKKVLNQKCPIYLFEKLTFVNTISERTRRDDRPLLCIKQHTTDKERGSFWISGALLWNQLPATVLRSNSPESFKRKAYVYIFQHHLQF